MAETPAEQAAAQKKAAEERQLEEMLEDAPGPDDFVFLGGELGLGDDPGLAEFLFGVSPFGSGPLSFGPQLKALREVARRKLSRRFANMEAMQVVIDAETGETHSVTHSDRFVPYQGEVPPAVVEKFERAIALRRQIRANRAQIQLLLKEAEKLDRNAERVLTILDHDRWKAFPRQYGVHDLNIVLAGGQYHLCAGRSLVGVLKGDVAKPLFDRAQKIQEWFGEAEANRIEAKSLQQRVDHEPELFQVLLDEADEALAESNPDFMVMWRRGDATIQASTRDGSLTFMVRVVKEEVNDQIPQRVRRLLAAICEDDQSLPESVRQALGLPSLVADDSGATPSGSGTGGDPEQHDND